MSGFRLNARVLDFFLPTTDAGVAAQFVGLAAISTVALYVTRNQPDARLLVIGLSLLALGVMAIRAIH